MKERKRVAAGGPWGEVVGYSRAVRVGDRVYVAGTTALGDDGKPSFAGDPYRQTLRVFEIIAGALREVGAEMRDVVRTRMFVTDMGDWKEIGRAHGEVFGEVRPAATIVEVSRLIEPGLCVEIEVEAVVG